VNFSSRAAIALVVLGLGCESSEDQTLAPFSPQPAGSGIDRLGPGELAPGKAAAFGFVAPALMKLERRFPDAAHFVGPVAAESLANYVRVRVEAERVEIGAARTLFPSVKIKGGAPDKTYRIEVVSDGVNSKLVIKDITPPATEPGLSEAERWRRAGFTPDGKPLDQQRHGLQPKK
jgi:hypothetical protein